MSDLDSSTPLQFPLQPSSPSLQSHISALDHLSLQLQHLTSTTRKDVRIPLGSKASIRGEIIHTNDIKINVGPEKEWFIDMTAQEASQYVERRKAHLLEEHARILEGRPRPSSLDGLDVGQGIKETGKKGKASRASEIGLHPIFYQMTENAVAGPSKLYTEEQIGAAVQKEEKSISETQEGDTVNTVDSEITYTPSSKSAENLPAVIPQTKKEESSVKASLVELLDDEGENEDEDESNVAGSSNSLGGDDTTLNEEGLPIHEIRETLSGETIGPTPPQSSDYLPESSKSTSTEEKEDDYFSPEAVARRAALRRRLFNEDTSSDEEDEVVRPTTSQGSAIKAKGGIIRSTSTSEPKELPASSPISTSPPTTLTSNPKSTSKSPSSPPVRERRPSSSQPQPSKSILKPPKHIERKKSVSFDPSLPSPPSPPPAHGHGTSNFGFPLPLAVDGDSSFSNDNDEFKVKPVPIIPTPQPGKKNEHSFAGFKKGFLDQKAQPQSSSSSSPISNSQNAKTEKPKLTAVKDMVAEKPISKPQPTPKSAQSTTSTTPSPVVPEDKPKKQSLFSQRLNHHEIDASAPNINTTPSSSSSSKIPSLPKVSESKGTNTVKSGVIEKPPVPVQSGVKEQPGSSNLKIVERPLKPINDRNQSSAVQEWNERSSETGSKYHENFDDDEEDEDEFSEYSTGEEDEYDLDEALLAREVALEYHKRQIYKPLNRDPDEEEGDEGGVMLGLPSISPGPGQGTGDPYNQTGSPMIINPTPDDLRRFIRIGKLENGNLVLAPGEESLETDDEDEDHDREQQGQGGVGPGGEEEKKRRKERKENRDRIKRTLMGLEIPSFTDKEKEKEEIKLKKGKERLEQDWKDSLPPTLASDSLTNSNNHTQSTKTESEEESHHETKTTSSARLPIIPLVPESEPEQSSSGVSTLSILASAPTPTPVSSTTTTEQTEKEVEKPKKVSRFKAARMAGNQ